jgi:hypothetical protein
MFMSEKDKAAHEDQGQHLGQKKQEAGEIGKDAPHGKSAEAPGQNKEAEEIEEDVEGGEENESGS